MNNLKDSALTVVVTLVAIFAMILIITSFSTKSYYYNAYSNEFEEYFVIKSYKQLPLDTVVYFNNKTEVSNKISKYTAHILSVYIK